MSYASAESPRNVLLEESTAVLKAAIQMDHGELLEMVDGRDFYEAQRVTTRNPGEKQGAGIWDK